MRDEYIDQIRRFYETSRQEVYTYALSITRSVEVAEDVIHTVFCKMLDRGRPPRELRPYVFRSIRNAAIDELRRRVAPQTQFGGAAGRVTYSAIRSLRTMTERSTRTYSFISTKRCKRSVTMNGSLLC